MRICKRILNFVQIIDYKGTIRLCGWLKSDSVIGSLSTSRFKEIYHGEKADYIRNKLAAEDYSVCNIDGCPYLSMNDMENHMVEIDEIPEYPAELYLAYEEVCNYACTSCTTPNVMKCNLHNKEIEQGYAKIEKELEDVLPHIKLLSANGRGELFASRHIMNILANWKPLAPKEEVSVILETNGSLFDAKHWDQISNLGQYNLHVAITVMSFDQKTYQILSGTKLPISQIENNLRFVKSLREQGIVNYFEIATVVQERNFRTMPEFARRCVEEFGADYVRLRPYNPWGSREPEIEWFTDPRNPLHPYNAEYLEVMSDLIFKHSKVHDWGGGRPSTTTGDFPNRVERQKFDIISRLIMDEQWVKRVKGKLGERQYVIYGIAEIGRSVINACGDELTISYIIDKYHYGQQYKGRNVYSVEQAKGMNKDVVVIITPLFYQEQIRESLKEAGYVKNVFSIEELLYMEDCT